jgi:hypothetical protein
MQSRVTGWWVFAAILLGVSGILNVIWGIAAIGDSHFFTANAHYIFSNLNTWGWITLIIGVVELVAAFSLVQGGGFGKAIGIIAAALASIDAPLSIPAAPVWSICVFALSIIVIYVLAKHRRASPSEPSSEPPAHSRPVVRTRRLWRAIADTNLSLLTAESPSNRTTSARWRT